VRIGDCSRNHAAVTKNSTQMLDGGRATPAGGRDEVVGNDVTARIRHPHAAPPRSSRGCGAEKCPTTIAVSIPVTVNQQNPCSHRASRDDSIARDMCF